MLHNTYDENDELVLERIDGTDGDWAFEQDLVAIDPELEEDFNEVYVSTSKCDDDGMPLWRQCGFAPHPIDPYFSREAGDVEWGEENDSFIIYHPEMVPRQDIPRDDEAQDRYRDARAHAEKVFPTELTAEPIETLQEPMDGPLPWFWKFNTKKDKDGKEKLSFEPNWTHLNAMKEVLDNLESKIKDRIRYIETPKKYAMAKSYIKKLSRAGTMQSKGTRYDEEIVDGFITKTLLPQGLNYTRYAHCWNALLAHGVEMGWEKEPKFLEIKEYPENKWDAPEITDAADGPREGFFRALELQDELDLEKATLERFSNKNCSWEPSERIRKMLSEPPVTYFRMTTEEILGWMRKEERV